MTMRKWWKIAGLAALWVSAPALSLASPEQSLQPGSVMRTVERLKPGEYLWLPQIAPEGPVIVIVSVTTQRAIVYRNGVPIGVSTISTGKKGHETPTGIFTILQKKVEHVSNLYDAPMPYMQRLTWGGIALHAGDLPGYPASHGCIRLPAGFAKRLYSVTRLGLTVVVTDEAALPRAAPLPQLGGDTRPLATADAGDAILWRPDLSPVGPVSIIVSAADKRVIVLRNGKEIGSAPVAIDAVVTGTSAYSLRATGAQGMEWLRLPLPGSNIGAGEQPYRGKLIVDERFREAVVAQLRPGATVVITADSLRRGAAGRDITIELAEPHD